MRVPSPVGGDAATSGAVTGPLTTLKTALDDRVRRRRPISSGMPAVTPAPALPTPAPPAAPATDRPIAATTRPGTFAEVFGAEFARRFPPLYRYLARLSGDPALAADLTQEAFVRLYQRGRMPDDAGAWLATVAGNLFRTHHQRVRRRLRLLSDERSTHVLADAPASPAAAAEQAELRDRVRAALDTLDVRSRQLLLLRAEGYSYRELAAAVGVAEASVGTLLARAKAAFRLAIGGAADAPE